MWDIWLDSVRKLAEPLQEPVLLAIPVFVLFVGLEWGSQLAHERHAVATGTATRDGGRTVGLDGRPLPGSFGTRTAFTSIGMGLTSQFFWFLGKLLGLLLYTAIYIWVAPWQLSPTAWWTWAIAILGTDLLYYLYHRGAHRIRLLWASHQAHHSAEDYNFATALRQKWNNLGEVAMWIPLALVGLPPWMMFTGFSVSLIYQFFLHTERVDRLPAPIEYVFNTPSHHRVHHGRDREYIDKNFGGMLIIWDRMFGTFQPETHRPDYGLLTMPPGDGIWTLQTWEYAAIARDVRRARSWRDRAGYMFGPPGWKPRPQESSPAAVVAASDEKTS